MKLKHSIRKRLILMLVALAIGPMLLLGTVLSVLDFREGIAQVRNRQAEINKRVRSTVEFYLMQQETALLVLLESNRLFELPPSRQRALLQRFRSSMKNHYQMREHFQREIFEELSLLDEQGNTLLTVSRTNIDSEGTNGTPLQREELNTAASSHSSYFGPVYFEPDTGEPFMNISMPDRDPLRMKVNGFLVAKISLKFIWDVIASLRNAEGNVSYILDSDGHVVAHPNSSIILRGTVMPVPPSNGNTIRPGLSGQRSLISVEKISHGEQVLYVVTESPLLRALEIPFYSLATIVAFVLISLIGAVLLGVYAVRNVVKPVESLAATARGIAAGDMTLKSNIEGADEFGALSAAFNAMTAQLVDVITSLQTEKDKLQAYLDTAAVMVVILDIEGRVQLINHRGCEILKRNESEVLGLDWYEEFVSSEYRQEARHEHQRVITSAEDSVSTLQSVIMTADGEQRTIAWYNKVLRDVNGKVTASLNSGVDITEATLAERKIIEQSELIKGTLESLSHPFFVIDARDYTVKIANSACGFGPLTETSKCHKLTHKSDSPCQSIDHPCTVREIFKTRKPVTFEHLHYDKNGSPLYFEVHGYPIFDENGEIVRVIEYNIDITQRRQLEHQLIQAQKMESVGRLAGGVAHDFNNILTAIIGYGELVMNDLPVEHALIRDRVQIMLDAAGKAATLTKQLLAFSRKQILQVRIISLNDVIENIMKILYRLIGEDVELTVELNSKTHIKADASQFEQVLLNLVVNARDAMPDGGRLNIVTSDVELDQSYANLHTSVVPGLYSKLEVTDNGTGMSREVQEKIFEPFFSTKGTLGTGLGLATVYGIIKQHSGYIYVYSEPGMGTSFKIYMPATVEEKTLNLESIVIKEYHGAESLLIVDDDEAIRLLLVDTLQPLGYTVYQAGGGADAIALCQRVHGRIDLLITDVVMPEMSGEALADAIRAINAGVKVIFMSGYTDEIVARHGILSAGVNFMQKPIVPSELVRKIREVLEKEE